MKNITINKTLILTISILLIFVVLMPIFNASTYQTSYQWKKNRNIKKSNEENQIINIQVLKQDNILISTDNPSLIYVHCPSIVEDVYILNPPW